MSNAIPDGWTFESVDEISADHKGAIKIGPFGSALSKNEMVSSGIKVYGQENIYKNDFLIGNYFITEEKYQKLKTCTLKRGDVVITMMGTVGSSTVVPEDAEIGVMDSHLLRIQVDAKRIHRHLLAMQLRDSQDVKEQIRKMSQGGIMSGLNAAIVKSIKVPVPPLPEQKKIANILSSVDDVIEKTQAQFNKLKDLKTGMMQELLTKGIGHTEYKDSPVGLIPVGWDVVIIGDCTSRFYQGINTVADKIKYHPEGTRIIQAKHITSGTLDMEDARFICDGDYEKYKDKFQPKVDDLLFSNIGTIGKSVIVEKNQPFLLAWNVFLIRVEQHVSPKFMHFYLQYLDLLKYYDDLMTGNATKFVNKTSLGAIAIPVPSVGEQQKIVSALTSVDCKWQIVESKLKSLKIVKKALMQDLLTGKVRVTIN